jgi:hypothetical protein
MSQTALLHVELPPLYERLNRLRVAGGMAPVEPRVIAVRAGIRFALLARRTLDFGSGAVELAPSELPTLRSALLDLFNVDLPIGDAANSVSPVPRPAPRPQTTSVPVVEPEAGSPVVRLPLERLYLAINEQRRLNHLMPVEPAVVSVRCGLRYAVLRHQPLSFEGDALQLDARGLTLLEEIIAELFDVSVPGGLASLAATAGGIATGHAPAPPLPATSARARWWQRLFGRLAPGARLYEIDTDRLILSILNQRARIGFRPLAPSAVRARLSAQTGQDLDALHATGRALVLSAAQASELTRFIGEEFQVVRERLDQLTEMRPH